MLAETQIVMACITLAANTYQLPIPILKAIYAVEGGKTGMANRNNNGTYDYGVMQVNSLWVDVLHETLNLPHDNIANALQYDACANVGIAAWILSNTIAESNGDIRQGVGYYHSRTTRFFNRYIDRIEKKLNQQ